MGKPNLKPTRACVGPHCVQTVPECRTSRIRGKRMLDTKGCVESIDDECRRIPVGRDYTGRPKGFTAIVRGKRQKMRICLRRTIRSRVTVESCLVFLEQGY